MFIEINGIKKHFGEKESRVDVLKGIDLTLEKGEFSVFVKMAIAGIVSYSVIAFFEYKKVKKIPLDMALKNRE